MTFLYHLPPKSMNSSPFIFSMLRSRVSTLGTTIGRRTIAYVSVRSPYDGRELSNLPLATAEDAEKALQRAHNLFVDRKSWLPIHRRIEILHKLKQVMASQASSLADQIIAEGGKPRADAEVEVVRAIDGVDVAIHTLASHVGHQIPMGKTAPSSNRLAWTIREPIGPVVAVSAFNHPLNLIVHQVIPGVAVGCPVIVKPSLATPLSCLRLVDLLKQAGLPDGYVQAVIGDNAVSEQLATDRRLGFFSFIGSAKVGWMLRSKLAPGVRCALEHGGAAPVIVVDDDIDHIIPTLIKGGFYHAGQVCVSVQRIFVPHHKAQEFATKLANAAAKLNTGDPNLSTTDVGPLITSREADRVESWVNEAVENGAVLLTGGKRLAPTLYAPTVLLNPPQHVRVSTQEIFGPVVCVYGYDSEDEAVALANSLPYAFQASVFSKGWETALDLGQKLNASAVMINESSTFRVDWMPFAGRMQSGLGVGGINYTMEDMTQEKMFLFRFSNKTSQK